MLSQFRVASFELTRNSKPKTGDKASAPRDPLDLDFFEQPVSGASQRSARFLSHPGGSWFFRRMAIFLLTFSSEFEIMSPDSLPKGQSDLEITATKEFTIWREVKDYD
jgi:hypothetical protein